MPMVSRPKRWSPFLSEGAAEYVPASGDHSPQPRKVFTMLLDRGVC